MKIGSAVQKLQHFSEIQDGDCHQSGMSLICPIHQNGKKVLTESLLQACESDDNFNFNSLLQEKYKWDE